MALILTALIGGWALLIGRMAWQAVRLDEEAAELMRAIKARPEHYAMAWMLLRQRAISIEERGGDALPLFIELDARKPALTRSAEQAARALRQMGITAGHAAEAMRRLNLAMRQLGLQFAEAIESANTAGPAGTDPNRQ